jgi:uroporphyrinogen III methyltransferase / synthase
LSSIILSTIADAPAVVTAMSKVYILGAGPGHSKYLTIQARDILAIAEVLIYDALVDRELLDLVPAECVLVDVGKRGGQPSMPQPEINRILIERARSHQYVVRLKSGDPFIFGRVTAELDALIGAGIDYEVVPGLSSALAAPLLAGIPLTDPVLSRSFSVVTAHEPDDLDWATLAQIQTLVILMGGRNLPEIIGRLLKHDRPGSTPIAIIRWAGTSKQEVWVSELDRVAFHTDGANISPAVIVIGRVVQLREYFHGGGAKQKASAGKTALITRAASQSSEFNRLLADLGMKSIEMPTLEIVPPSSWHHLDRAIEYLTEFDWLILTSTNAVDYFFERLHHAGKDSRALAGVSIAVVGQKTAQSLQKHGIQADFIPPNFIADALVANFPTAPAGQKILFPRVETGGREVLVRELTDSGAIITEVPAYESRCPLEIDPTALAALQQERVDVITFASSKTVKYFCELIGDRLPENWQQRVIIASIGPQTSIACQELLGKVDIEATEYTIPGLVAAIDRHFNSVVSNG